MLPSLGGGGQQLGVAQGAIRIDTSSLQQAVASARRAGQEINRSLGGTAARGVNRFRESVTSLRRELIAIGAVSALTTAFGVQAARDLRNYRIAFETLLGTQEEADEIMKSLADGANQYGLEITNVFRLGRQLLPVLEGNVEATGEWVKRAARLRTVFPAARQGAELRAISEFLADQERSLIRLFNIPPEIVQEAKAQFDDVGQQMDFILQRMGATEEAAQRMANPLISVKNELKLIAATGFRPILMQMREVLPEFREWLEDVRQTQPEILEIGGAFATAAAVGAPFLIFLNQALGALQKIKALGIIGLLGRAGIAVGAAFAAREGVRAVGRARGDERLAGIGFREMLFDAGAAILDVASIIVSAIGFAAAAIENGFGAVAQVLGRFVQWLGSEIPDRFGGRQIAQGGQELEEFGTKLRETAETDLSQFARAIADTRDDLRQKLGRALGVLPDPMEAAAIEERRRTPGMRRGAPIVGGGGAAFTDEQLAQIEAWNAFQADLAQIEREAQQQRLEATRQYEQQRSEIIAQYEQTILREEQDFNRQRRRDNAQLDADIAEIRADRQEQEIEWQEDLNERIAEIQADAARQRERMQEDHRDNLLSAAARLDAQAVAQENRRFAKQMTRFEEDLQERIDAEREAHQERVQQAREADQERIENMREAAEERQAIEDEERAIRLERMEEDHERQLDELDRQHQVRLDQIDAQEKQELAERRRIFQNEWMPAQRSMQEQSLMEFENYLGNWLRIQNKFLNETGAGGTSSTDGGGGTLPSAQELAQQAINLMQQAGWTPRRIYNQSRAMSTWSAEQIAQWIEQNFDVDVPGYALGTGFVPRTGLATLHRGEAVIDAATANMLRMGQNFTPRQMAGAMVSGGRHTTLNIASGAIQVNGAAGPAVTAQRVLDLIERELKREML